MATYKVLQDIEAEDKLIGPLSPRQCIYAAIAVVAGYLSYLSMAKGATFLVAFLLPFIAFGLFFAWPWSKQQSTEVWALAKIRFALKPRKRIWDQSGIKELVTVTAPKKIEGPRVSDLSETEVRSRLKALAETIDSRGWAVKNVPLGMYTQPYGYQGQSSDRLVDVGNLPQEVPSYDTTASDDMFDMANNPVAQHFESKISAATTARHQQLVNQIDNPLAAQPAAPAPVVAQQNYWYMAQPASAPVAAAQPAASAGIPQAATPDAQDEALAAEIRRKQDILSSPQSAAHLRTIQPLAVQAAQAQAQAQADAAAAAAAAQAQQNENSQTNTMTPPANPAILELANNNDLNVATIAREAQRSSESPDEVVVSLH